MLNVAKFLIPKSIPTELSVWAKFYGYISTTKLRKYLVGAIRESPLQSLTIVTDYGTVATSLNQTIFSFPILVR